MNSKIIKTLTTIGGLFGAISVVIAAATQERFMEMKVDERIEKKLAELSEITEKTEEES